MDAAHPPRLTTREYMSHCRVPVQVFRDVHPGVVSLHWHEFYELSYVVSGRGVQCLNGALLPLSPGVLFLLTPADFHELHSADNDPLEIYNVIFTEYFIDDEIYRWLFAHGHVLQSEMACNNRQSVLSDYQRLQNEITDAREGSELIIKATLQRLFIDLVRRVSDTGHPHEVASASPLIDAHLSPMPKNLQKALIYIHHHFRENLTLTDAAHQAQYSPTYFSEVFSRTVGQTFQRYLQTLRIDFAASLLKVSELSVTEIGYASGFNTLGHFERMFRVRKGISPRDYRQVVQSPEELQQMP